MDKTTRTRTNTKPAFLAGGAVLMLGLGMGGAMMLPTNAVSQPAGPITVTVPGAVSVSVYCGGDETAHGKQGEVTFTPEGATCYVEAPLTPVMPLRGAFELGAANSYRCERDNVELVCRDAG